MKIVREQSAVILPEAIEPSTADITAYSAGDPQTHPNGHWVAVIQIKPQKLQQCYNKEDAILGVPIYWAISLDNKVITFYPPSDVERTMDIRACPVMRKW